MFEKMRLSAARALFALIVVISLGLGLLVAGVAAVFGVLMVAAFRIAMGGQGRSARTDPADAVQLEGAPAKAGDASRLTSPAAS